MALHAQLSQIHVQKLMLTPKMRQAIELLQLSTMELQTFLRQELVQNPVLEELQEPPEEADGDAGTAEDEVPQKPEPDVERELKGEDKGELNLEYLMNDWDDYRPREERDPARYSSMEDSKRRFIENAPSNAESLTSHLMRQLGLSTTSTKEYEIGEWIISEIDGRGYFCSTLEVGAEKFGLPMEEIEEVLKKIQTFTPVGVGARDLSECLLIQVQSRYPDNVLLTKIVTDHIHHLGKKQFHKIASALKMPVEEVQTLAETVATLEPNPGHALSYQNPQYIIPDVVVKELDDGEYTVIVNDDGMPKLRISSFYRKLLKDGRTSREATDYIKDKYRSASWLVKNVQQRRETIRRVTESIVETQREFLEKGVAYLKPLTLREIAEKVNIHESTVSRVTTNKYVDTPRGIYELKYFFSSGIDNEGGETKSSTAIKAIIRNLINSEDKKKPYSDQKITDILNRRGFRIARRTAAKYREELGILPSKLRREY